MPLEANVACNLMYITLLNACNFTLFGKQPIPPALFKPTVVSLLKLFKGTRFHVNATTVVSSINQVL